MGISDGLVFGSTRSGQFRKLISRGEQEGKVNTVQLGCKGPCAALT